MPDEQPGNPKPTTRRRRRPASGTSKASPAAKPTDVPAPEDAIADGTPTDVAADIATPVEVEGVADPGAEPAAADVVEDRAGPAAIWPLLDARSPNEWVCPFLRSVDDADRATAPIEAPDVANRCAALEDVVPQSLRQQELVCLTNAHVNCPRYLRGAVVVGEVSTTSVRTTPTITPAMFGALALLAAAFTASVVFTLARGGLELEAGAPGSSPSASAVAVIPTPVPSVQPSIAVSPVPSVEASPTPVVSEAPSPTPSPETPSPTPAPSAATPAPAPTSDRYELLTACPDQPDCWLYRIRSGDNLFSIARYFGVPLATVKALNPWTANGLKVGRDLILPPPTR